MSALSTWPDAATLQRQWLQEGSLHLENALAPGLAAQLVEVFRRLPAQLTQEASPRGGGAIWRCDLVVPFTADLVGPEAWTQICLGFKTRLIHPDRLDAETVEQTLADVHKCLQTPGAFAQSLVYVAVGTVSEDETVRI